MAGSGSSELSAEGASHASLRTQDSALSTVLSTRARRALDVAHELARRDRTVEPHSGHVLIALLREGGGVVEDTATRLGIEYEDVLSAVDAAETVMVPAPSATDRTLPVRQSTELPDLLRAAERIAKENGQVIVSAAHLLLAVASDSDLIGARALAALGVERAALTEVVYAGRDMLVPLLMLPDPAPAVERARAAGVAVRRAKVWDEPALRAFITGERFARTWAPEAAVAFTRQPAAVFLALRGEQIVGFAAYDCGNRGIFGPTGVAREERRGGVAAALLLRTLADMRAQGYVYAIIGAVGPAEFYERVVGAVLLPSAWPSYVTSE
jgi:hypothetical protein